MAELDDDYSCEICCEPYDIKNQNKLPKLTSCCSHTFCLSCLLDIFNRNNHIFKCPYCRKSSNRSPREYKTNTKLFSHYLICCHCENKVLQDELFLCLDNGNMDIKCAKCQDENDYKLVEYLPALLNELKIFCDYYQRNKNFDLIFFIREKIKKQIEKYTEEIIEDMTNLMTKKIIKELKQETNYDLEFEKNEFDKKLKKVEFDYKYLNDFYKNEPTKIFDSKKILEILKFYDSNVETLQKDMKKLADFKIVIENNNLFNLKENVDKEKLCNFILSNFETILSELPKPNQF